MLKIVLASNNKGKLREFGKKKRIVMEPIKTPGITEVTVKLHKEINAVVNVEVEAV